MDKLFFYILLVSFLLLYNGKVYGEMQVTFPFGAKAALLDSSISLKEALLYAIQDEYIMQARYEYTIVS
ncbi:hypothetical protein SM124_05740 [Bacillus sp. 31A1R]|uniref:Uncharacterized protein n=1 Tax=Robertmurraya mangrovi TaxID=3098077 RepID=A0ABU5IVQ4_9BACI|nr:hypothetical protein [Bacillus sp. 31A1R]MDZ5471243.1 hypothetical protein [Bacillus sp. 31A1R]